MIRNTPPQPTPIADHRRREAREAAPALSPAERVTSIAVLEPDAATSYQNGRKFSKLFKALSDETRRGILHLLERHACSVGEIVGEFDLAQPTISRHLSVLREADLVISRRHGQHVIYHLNPEALASTMSDFFAGFRQCQDLLR